MRTGYRRFSSTRPAKQSISPPGGVPDSLLALVREPLALAAGTTRAIHFCLGNIACKPLIEVQNLGALILFIQQLDGVVDRVHVECFYSGQWDERALLPELPPSMEIIADVKSKPAPMTELCEKIEQLAQAIAPQRLLISGSCGVSRVPHDDAIRLMRNLVEAALACRPPNRWISAAPYRVS